MWCFLPTLNVLLLTIVMEQNLSGKYSQRVLFLVFHHLQNLAYAGSPDICFLNTFVVLGFF